MPSRMRKFGLQVASWMLAAPTTGPQYRCGAICTCCTSAIAAIFFASRMPPHAAEIHLQDRRRLRAQHAREVVLGRKALAGRDRDAGRARHERHLLRRIRGHGLLEPQRIVGLEAPREPDRPRSRHLSVGAEQQVGARADRLAQLAHEALAQFQRLKRQLPAVEGRVRSRRVELDRREPLGHILRGPLGGELRVLVDVGLVSGPRVDIGIGAQPLVHATAQEVVDRLPRLLADDVPAGHLERARAPRHQRQIGVLGVACRVHASPERLDLVRILALKVAREYVLEHARHQLRGEGHAVSLADARARCRRS